MRVVLLTAAAIATSGLVVPVLVAQSATVAVAASNPKLVGTWTGNYTTDGPSGPMSLVISKPAEWAVKVELSGDVPTPGEPTDVSVVGDKVTWRQTYGEFDVTFVATMSEDGTRLTGTLEAKQGGSYAAGGNFALTKN
ncbi:MAG: hypothetical protein KF785_05290 [Gemmatimonadales bacterium]|nr:hypothetical protein [Gemmatimonadales bacterium]